jgi:hypothetical protein
LSRVATGRYSAGIAIRRAKAAAAAGRVIAVVVPTNHNDSRLCHES